MGELSSYDALEKLFVQSGGVQEDKANVANILYLRYWCVSYGTHDTLEVSVR